MAAKEWLEDIKERFVKYEYDYNLNGEDVEWLIEQAERVQELEREIERYREAIDKIKGELYKMSAWGKEEISMLDIIHDLEGEE